MLNTRQAKGGHDGDQPAPNQQSAKTDTPLSVATFTDQLNLLRDDLFGKIDSVVGSLRSGISAVRDELVSSANVLRATADSHTNWLVELESTAVFCGDSVQDLQTAVNDSRQDVSFLKAECEDLESRSRRNNVRVVGLREDTEGTQAATSMAKWLHDTLHLDSLPVIDRAHRPLRPKPKTGEAPRPMIIRLHYYQDRVANSEVTINIVLNIVRIQKARDLSDALQHEGKRVHIFPDLTAAQMKK
ncbi:hypothetical protein ABVT39_008820 [Epinephelus coioides]